MEHLPLAELWFALLALLAVAYAVTDGTDLGVGILCLFTRDEDRRGILLATVEGVWHANQTWLVILGGVVFGAFPLGYGAVLSALYGPAFLLLFGLILRGVCFEFRGEARQKTPWSVALGVGSLLAAVSQGMVVGGLLGGLKVQGDQYAGGFWDWVNPSCWVLAFGAVAGYTLLGACWAAGKAGEVLRRWALAAARIAAAAALASGVLLWGVTGGAPASSPRAWLPWALSALTLPLLFRSLTGESRRSPFLWAAAGLVLSLAGIAGGLYPLLVPPSVTVQDAAAPAATMMTMMAVVGLLIPVMVAYNAYQFWVFRGPAVGEGYGAEAGAAGVRPPAP